MEAEMTKHPIQPLELDAKGVLRFKKNRILECCVEQSNLSKLTAMFDRDEYKDDWNQLAQVIGYSHSGAPSYLTEETWQAALKMHKEGKSELQARYEALRDEVARLEDRIARATKALVGYDE